MCRSQTVDTVVQARPSCIKIRAGAEHEGTHECVRGGEALPCSSEREAESGWYSKQGEMLEAPWAGKIIYWEVNLVLPIFPCLSLCNGR